MTSRQTVLPAFLRRQGSEILKRIEAISKPARDRHWLQFIIGIGLCSTKPALLYSGCGILVHPCHCEAALPAAASFL
jgi:hypothetical protein